MKPIVRTIALVLLFSCFSCKKLMEKKAEEMLMDAITNGVWIVEQYFENSSNLSSEFYPWQFKFHDDGSVAAYVSDSTLTGAWAGNIRSATIDALFSGASDPLKKLNGTWKIKDSNWSFVKAEMPTATGKNLLVLRKKP